MLQERLNNLKLEPCCRWDSKARALQQIEIAQELKTRFPICLGLVDSFMIDTPYGWKRLVTSMLENLEPLRFVRIRQIKQKFGRLVVHWDWDMDIKGQGYVDAAKVIASAEQFALTICEFCSSREDVGFCSDGYVSSSCRSCQVKIDECTLLSWILTPERKALNKLQQEAYNRLEKNYKKEKENENEK